MEQHTINILTKILEGESIPLTKSETNEVLELLPKLKNLGLLQKPRRFEYAISTNSRKPISKLIELRSWTDFLDWFDRQNTDSNIVNDFAGSTIGQVNQSSGKLDLKSPIKQKTVHNAANEPKKKSWIEILAWIIGIIAGFLAIYEFIIKK